MSHLDTPEFPLSATEDAVDGPSHRQAHEIGPGAIVIRSTEDGHAVCLKLNRIGKEYIQHYVIVLDPHPEGDMELLYIDPEEKLFDCFATLEVKLGDAAGDEDKPDVGHAFENKDGHFVKVLDDPKAQKLFGFVELNSGLVKARQERKVKTVHKDWKARARIQEDVLDLAELLIRFAKQL